MTGAQHECASKFQLIRPFASTCMVARGDQIRVPSAPDAKFQLLLQSLHPRAVVFLCDANGAVTKQPRYLFNGHPIEKAITANVSLNLWGCASGTSAMTNSLCRALW